MATKANRKAVKKSSGAPRSYSQLYKSDSGGVQQPEPQPQAKAGPAVVRSAAPAAPAVRQPDFDWDREYNHIYRDLRNLGIVSAALAAAIVIAGFIF